MPSSYSANLGTQLMQTGENAGTWGVNTNFNLGTLMEQAISSYVKQAMTTGTTVILTIVNGQDGGGNTDPTVIYGQNSTATTSVPVSGRNMYIELTGTGGGGATLQVPVNRKLYFVYNNTNGAVTVKVSGGTGVSVPAGKKYLLVCDGTDISLATSTAYAVSVASSNGFAGTSDGASNPTLTLSTTQSGILRGVSGALVASTTIYESGGNIGIGTATPSAVSGYTSVTVNGTTGSLLDSYVNGTLTGRISVSSNTYQMYAQGASTYLAFGTNGAERMRIDTSGNVGIGVTPSSWDSNQTAIQLRNGSANAGFIVADVSSNFTSGSNCYLGSGSWKYYGTGVATLYGQGGSAGTGAFRWYVAGSGTAGNTITDFATAKMTLSNAGGLSVGTTADPGAGAIYATGNITAYYSDDRLKTRKGNIENALSKVLSLDGFHYEANETAQALGYKAKPEVGLSAQQVQAVLPEVVVPAPIDEQYLTVHYERLIPLLVEAIKEQNKKIEALEARLNGMR